MANVRSGFLQSVTTLIDQEFSDGVGFGAVKDQANTYGPLSIATPGIPLPWSLV